MNTKIRLFVIITTLKVFILSNSLEAKITTYQHQNSNDKSPRWVTSFQELRGALYQNDFSKINSFFTFPIKSNKDNNLMSLWLICTDDYNDSKPFTSEDFKKYQAKIFRPELIQALLSIKSDSLALNNQAFSSKKYRKNGYIYVAFVQRDRKHNTLTISLNSQEANQKYIERSTENNTYLIFKILPSGDLKFSNIALAG
jgi:hypothetical protein